MELETTYPYFVPFNSQADARGKIDSINEILRPTWTDGVTNNYDIARGDVNGKWWVIVNQITEEYFTPEELYFKASFEDLELKIKNL